MNSVSANVPVSDFIETLQIIPSGTIPFVVQAAGQGSQLISVYNFQGGTAYTAGNMFTVYAGDKIHFNWKQSGFVQNTAQLSYVICYLVKGTNPVPQPGDRIEVGRIYQYVYFSGDHEEIGGSFVYNVPSTFSFYRSQVEGAPNLVTQGQDYGAATATVYRATVPNSISVPTLINISNLSVDNLSTNLLNNISAGENITLSTEAVTNKLVITATGGLNSSNLSLDNLSVSANINVSNLSIAGDTDMIGKLTVGNIEFKNIGSTAVVSYLQTNMPSMKWFLKKTMDFRKDDDAGIVFMKLDHNVGNVNISNLSNANLSVGNVTGLESITAGSGGNGGGFYAKNGTGVFSTGGFYLNNAADGTGDNLNIFWTGGNVSAYGIGTLGGYDVRLANGYNTGGLVVSGSLNNINMSNCSINNLSTDNISSTLFSTTQIRLKDPADPATTKGSIFCNPNAFQYYGPNHVFFNNTVSPNVEYMRMDSSRSNVNISNLSSTNTSILNDMTITRDLDVDRYLSYKPRLLTRWRDNFYTITGTAQDVQWNRDETAMAGGALQASGDGIQALLAGWYRVDWSVGYRKMNNTGGERMTTRTYLRINNVFYGKYGYGSTPYLRSSSQNGLGFSSGSQLVYAFANDIIHVRTDCIIQGNIDFSSDFNGQRVVANSRFSCEYVSNSGET